MHFPHARQRSESVTHFEQDIQQGIALYSFTLNIIHRSVNPNAKSAIFLISVALVKRGESKEKERANKN